MDRQVNTRRAKKHGSETHPVLGFETADGAGAQEASQLDAGHDTA